jgi:hypothetical protein
MQKRCLPFLALVVSGLFLANDARAEGTTSLGGGVHYNKYVDDIDSDDVDDEAFSYVVALRHSFGFLLGFEADIEVQPEDMTAREEDTIIPQAYLYVGKVVYAGAGIGVGYYDGDFADEPNYYLRAGLDLEILPGFYLDVAARYVVQDIEEIEDEIDDNVDTDTITIGANARFKI